jgi:hypothetical protein
MHLLLRGASLWHGVFIPDAVDWAPGCSGWVMLRHTAAYASFFPVCLSHHMQHGEFIIRIVLLDTVVGNKVTVSLWCCGICAIA